MKEKLPVRAILLDFDGVICDLFAGYPSEQITQELIGLSYQKGYDGQLATDDPLELLRELGKKDRPLVREIDRLFAQKEYTAAESAQPIEGMHAFLDFCQTLNAPTVIVTNNSPASVKHYLRSHNLPEVKIFGRITGRPSLLKPSPYNLNRACKYLGVSPIEAVMVGDMTTDILAAQAARCASIGVSHDDRLQHALQKAGATHIASDAASLRAHLVTFATS